MISYDCPVPALTGLVPSVVAVGSPAFTLTINGSNFVPGSVVQVNGSPRSTAFFSATRIGNYPVMTAASIRLLAAEAQLRLGNVPAAAALIDVSRVGKGGLPSLVTAGIADTVTAVPGGRACVPKVPDPATAFKSAKCGTIWDALKWDYRIETAYTGYGNWFFPSRGWGDLPEGTTINWPVPYQEMDARAETFYGLGGVGLPGGAGPGNYGLFAGGVY